MLGSSRQRPQSQGRHASKHRPARSFQASHHQPPHALIGEEAASPRRGQMLLANQLPKMLQLFNRRLTTPTQRFQEIL